MEPEEFPVLKYTVQLYYSPIGELNDQHPIQIASGVLLNYTSKFYLITCKHVFDGFKPEDIFILTTSGFAIRLPNKIKFYNGENDSVDLALIRLTGNKVKELKTRYSFLSQKYIGFKHSFDEDLFYMLFGFVNSKTTRDSYVYSVESFAFLTNIRSYKKFEIKGYNYTNNVTLEYNRRKLSDFDDDTRKFGFKDLTGMSGGGVWLSLEGKKPNTYNYILVAIMIEQRLSNGFIVATKIGLIETMFNDN